MKRKQKSRERKNIVQAGTDPELLAEDVAEDQRSLEERVREALAEPDEPTTIAEFRRKMDELAKAEGYLNEYHREHSTRLKDNLSKQPKATLEEALAQYKRIKRGSKRRKP
jgi:hypothetical protein